MTPKNKDNIHVETLEIRNASAKSGMPDSVPENRGHKTKGNQAAGQNPNDPVLFDSSYMEQQGGTNPVIVYLMIAILMFAFLSALWKSYLYYNHPENQAEIRARQESLKQMERDIIQRDKEAERLFKLRQQQLKGQR